MPNGDDLQEFEFNLAASNPLMLFDPNEFDGEGNLFPSNLAVVWLGATAFLGSVHLFYDLQLKKIESPHKHSKICMKITTNTQFGWKENPSKLGGTANPWSNRRQEPLLTPNASAKM
jgi:hypothetical protein